MQAYLLEMLATYPNPAKLDIQFADRWVSPEQYGRDFKEACRALESRLGTAFSYDTFPKLESHRITFELVATAKTGWGRIIGSLLEPKNEDSSIPASPAKLRRSVIQSRKHTQGISKEKTT